MTDDQVPHDDYKAGFRAGWQAINGDTRRLPVIPMQPRILTMGWTWFTTGIKAAVELSLGVDDIDELRR